VLASLQRQLRLRLAVRALQSQHDLLRGLCFLVEHRLRLTTVTRLLTIVTTLSLCEERCLQRLYQRRRGCLRVAMVYLARFVLCHFMLSMFSAVFALAVGTSCLRNVDLGHHPSVFTLDASSASLTLCLPPSFSRPR
jgi:hypothetical protein